MSAMMIAGNLGLPRSVPVTIDHHAMVVTTSTSPAMGVETSISDAFVYQIFSTGLSSPSIMIAATSMRQRWPKCHRLADRDPGKIVPLPYNI